MEALVQILSDILEMVGIPESSAKVLVAPFSFLVRALQWLWTFFQLFFVGR